MQAIKKLSVKDKEVFFTSLETIQKNSDFFVIRFYHYFLHTKAGELFVSTNIDKQYGMFNASLMLIINHISNTSFFETYITELVQNHEKYGNMSDYVDFFSDSFIKALQEVFTEESDREIFPLWETVLSDILSYFK